MPRRWKVAYGEMSSSCPGIEPPAIQTKQTIFIKPQRKIKEEQKVLKKKREFGTDWV
jgi:hypothetical protein